MLVVPVKAGIQELIPQNSEYKLKQIIRNQIKAQLKNHTAKEDAAQKLLNNLLPLIYKASTIAIYHADSYELNLGEVINYCLVNDKKLYQPVSYRHSKYMRLMEYNPNYTNIFSSQEFIPDSSYEWYNLDLILLPLIAADKNGCRLGKGGGYYDTTLANIMQNVSRPILCGVGFDLQLISHIPHEDWDICLDYFVSEQQLIKF